MCVAGTATPLLSSWTHVWTKPHAAAVGAVQPLVPHALAAACTVSAGYCSAVAVQAAVTLRGMGRAPTNHRDTITCSRPPAEAMCAFTRHMARSMGVPHGHVWEVHVTIAHIVRCGGAHSGGNLQPRQHRDAMHNKSPNNRGTHRTCTWQRQLQDTAGRAPSALRGALCTCTQAHMHGSAQHARCTQETALAHRARLALVLAWRGSKQADWELSTQQKLGWRPHQCA